MPRNAATEVGLDEDKAKRLHTAISREAVERGEPLNYQEILEVAQEIADGTYY